MTLIRGGIEMEIELITMGVQPVGIVSLKNGFKVLPRTQPGGPAI